MRFRSHQAMLGQNARSNVVSKEKGDDTFCKVLDSVFNYGTTVINRFICLPFVVEIQRRVPHPNHISALCNHEGMSSFPGSLRNMERNKTTKLQEGKKS